MQVFRLKSLAPRCMTRAHNVTSRKQVASAAAVAALEPKAGDCILDLCCAPGATVGARLLVGLAAALVESSERETKGRGAVQ